MNKEIPLIYLIPAFLFGVLLGVSMCAIEYWKLFEKCYS
jgi:ABC-type microcin C transport system permease subunit YejB